MTMNCSPFHPGELDGTLLMYFRLDAKYGKQVCFQLADLDQEKKH
jgi:hypothetical protein